MANIFISFSPKDSRIMLTLREQLTRAGFRAWTDPEPRPNADWRQAIDDAIRASDAVVVVTSTSSAESIYVTYEWTLALTLGIKVIVLLAAPTRLHPQLEAQDRYDMAGFRDPAHFWDYFMRELHRTVRPRGGQMPAPAPIAPAPYIAPPAPALMVDRSVMPPHSGYWIVLRRGNPQNMMWQLTGATVSLGRDKGNDISIEDVGVSRYHMRFVQFAGGYAVEDVNSTNGVIINGNRIVGAVPLSHGTVMQLGDNIVLSYEAV